jgi:hypothetical protein
MSAVVDADAFRLWMAPKVAALQYFTSAVDLVAERHNRVPSRGSHAEIELDGEQKYSATSTWEKPITDCHTFGAMSLRAATDNVRGFGTLFTGGQPPLYPHLVLGRSALEGAVISEWLSDPSVEPLERIKRGL